jgi:hypothetical protein
MSAAFSRARAIAALIAAAVAAGAGLEGIPAYVSRGKGKGGRQASARRVAMDKREARKARNRAANRRAHA